VTAVLAFYLAAAEIINETHGRIVLPIGTPDDPKVTLRPVSV
jgi:succinate-acetate transporter protein